MTHKQYGRTYRLRKARRRAGGCCGCDFSGKECPVDSDGWLACLGDNNEDRVLRETLFSKIRNFVLDKCFCSWKPSPIHVWYSSCGYMPTFRPKISICPKCHKIIRIIR